TTTGRTNNLNILASEFPRLLSTFPGNGLISTITQFSAFAIPGTVPNTAITGTPVQALINTNAPTGCPRAIGVGATPPAGCTGYANLGNFQIGGPFDVINLGTPTAPLLFQAAQSQIDFPTAYTENYYTARFDLKISQRDDVTLRYINQKSAS